jgi:ferritin
MDETLVQAIQEWHTTERYNDVCYGAMAAQADNINLPGLARWLHKSSDDEREHAAKVAALLVDKSIPPEFQPLEGFEAPAESDDNHVMFFDAAMQREVATDATIKEIYAMAWEQGEYDVCQYMLWFLEEQRRSIREINDYLQMCARSVDRLVFDNSLLE